MHLFLVEDDSNVAGVFEDFCSRKQARLTIATNLQDALTVVDAGANSFDLAVCDLKIPATAGAVDEAVEFGLVILQKLIEKWPGVPIIVLSAFGTIDVVSDMMLDARQVDIYGTGASQPMLRFFQKARLLDAVDGIGQALRHLEAVAQIELHAPALTEEYRQALRIFARRKGGTLVEYQPLAGGRSGARTGLATVRSGDGAQKAHVVAKLTTHDRATSEKDRYRGHVSGRLGAASYADLTEEVSAGCGASAGLFYSVADVFNRDLFRVLDSDAAGAAAVVTTMAALCAPWMAGVPQTPKTWADVRRNLIQDADYELVARNYSIVAVGDDRAVQTRWTSQHGDLHGANILVDDTLRPVLIDYGRTGDASSVLDPITLELSAIFHPDSPLRDDVWPTSDDLGRWGDLDAYLARCPYPNFVRACRAWSDAVRCGERDLFATVTAFCLRNLQFADVDKARALALQVYSADRLNSA